MRQLFKYEFMTYVFLFDTASRSEFDALSQEVLMELFGGLGFSEVREDVVLNFVGIAQSDQKCGKNFRLDVRIHLHNALNNPICQRIHFLWLFDGLKQCVKLTTLKHIPISSGLWQALALTEAL
jgi:hypothetical protein